MSEVPLWRLFTKMWRLFEAHTHIYIHVYMRFKDLKNEKLSAFVEVPRAKIAQVAGKLGSFQ